MAKSTLLNALFLLSFFVSYVSAGRYVDFHQYSDGTYGWRKLWRQDRNLHPDDIENYAYAAYQEMVAEAPRYHISDSDIPSVMSVALWGSTSGDMLVLHSSIKGGRGSTATSQYVNSCSIGSHRVNGMCAEIANIAWARQYGYTRRPTFAVFGIREVGSGTLREGAMSPCGSRNGCQAHLDDPSIRGVCVSFQINNSKREEGNGKSEGKNEFQTGEACKKPKKLDSKTLPKAPATPKEKAPKEHDVPKGKGKSNGGKARAPRRHLEAALES